jgi:hypothetical protein
MFICRCTDLREANNIICICHLRVCAVTVDYHYRLSCICTSPNSNCKPHFFSWIMQCKQSHSVLRSLKLGLRKYSATFQYYSPSDYHNVNRTIHTVPTCHITYVFKYDLVVSSNHDVWCRWLWRWNRASTSGR